MSKKCDEKAIIHNPGLIITLFSSVGPTDLRKEGQLLEYSTGQCVNPLYGHVLFHGQRS